MVQQAMFAEYPRVPADSEIIDNLQGQAYAPLPFEIGKAACAELFSDFRAFVDICSEPGGKELQDSLTFSVNNKGNGAYFLNYRKPGEVNPHEIDRAPGKDHKYALHHGSQTTDRATKALGGALPSEMKSFLASCDDMYEAGRKAAQIGARALGFEGIFFSDDRDDDVHHLRLIDYLASDDPILGEAHFDRSVASLAISESSYGLRGVPGQNGKLEPVTAEYIEILRDNLKPIEHFEAEAKFFLAAGVNRLSVVHRAKVADLPLLGHDIINDHPGESRQSAVMFINPHNNFPGYIVPTKHETGFDDIIKKIQKPSQVA